jgi:hypothetical protein
VIVLPLPVALSLALDEKVCFSARVVKICLSNKKKRKNRSQRKKINDDAHNGSKRVEVTVTVTVTA